MLFYKIHISILFCIFASMPFTTKISVIIPIYNTENYIEKCVDSVLNQTLKEIEIILIDDGSTDNSWPLIQKYNQNTNVKIFKKENGGLSDARNYGILKASGEFLAFVDSDDFIEKNMMQKMYDLAQKHSAEIVLCNLHKVDENGKIKQKLPQISHLPEKIELEKDFTLFGEVSSFACNKIFKKELFSDVKFPLGLHFEDIATIPILLLKSKIIAKTDEFFYNYFERSGSITRNFNRKGLDMFKAIEMVKNEYKMSVFAQNEIQWKRFAIIQGFYSFSAYLARVKDEKLKQEMFAFLKIFLNKEHITKSEILHYKRQNLNYLMSLSLKKMIFYILLLYFPKLIIKE